MATTGERVRWARRLAGQRVQAAYLDHVLTPVVRQAHRQYDLGPTVSLLATRRGGSTWLLEVCSAGPGVCPLFEPLFGSWFRAGHGVPEVPVLAPGDDDPALERFLGEVMRGRQLTPRLRRIASLRQVMAADRFVVKHVNMSLAGGWLVERFPRSPAVVLIRHPCAVVDSLLRVEWSPKTVAAALADRPEGERRQARELLDSASTRAGALAAVWAVETRALLDQTTPRTAHLVSYEQAVDDVVAVVGPLLEAIGLPRPPDLAARAATPSHTTTAQSPLHHGASPVLGWTESLDPASRDEILAVVAAAGLEGFGADPRPDAEALHQRHAQPLA